MHNRYTGLIWANIELKKGFYVTIVGNQAMKESKMVSMSNG